MTMPRFFLLQNRPRIAAARDQFPEHLQNPGNSSHIVGSMRAPFLICAHSDSTDINAISHWQANTAHSNDGTRMPGPSSISPQAKRKNCPARKKDLEMRPQRIKIARCYCCCMLLPDDEPFCFPPVQLSEIMSTLVTLKL